MYSKWHYWQPLHLDGPSRPSLLHGIHAGTELACTTCATGFGCVEGCVGVWGDGGVWEVGGIHRTFRAGPWCDVTVSIGRGKVAAVASLWDFDNACRIRKEV